MASAFDDLLGNLVNKLKSVGVGSKTAAQKRAEIDYLTPSNIAAQAGQGTVSGPAEFYDMGRRTDYTYKPREYVLDNLSVEVCAENFKRLITRF